MLINFYFSDEWFQIHQCHAIFEFHYFQTIERAPAHSIHKKLSSKDHIVSPAPNAYGLQNFKPGQCAPAYTIGTRFENNDIEEEA